MSRNGWMLRAVIAEAENVALHRTIDRVWKALGIETYEQAEGKEISEIVSERCASRTIREAEEAK